MAYVRIRISSSSSKNSNHVNNHHHHNHHNSKNPKRKSYQIHKCISTVLIMIGTFISRTADAWMMTYHRTPSSMHGIAAATKRSYSFGSWCNTMMDWDEIAKPYESVRAEVLLQKSSKEFINDHNCANLIVPKKAVASPYPSPMEAILVHNRRILIKHDDLLRLPGSNASGNKARKMLALSLISTDEFPDAVVSFGGPQSNAMVSIAAIVAAKNVDIDPSSDERKRFIYYTKKLPRYLRKQPNGNLLRAKSLGMELIEMSHDEYRNIFGGPSGGSSQPPAELDPPILTNGGKSLWVPQGGAFEAAALGIRSLAQEIAMFWVSVNK